MLLSISVERAEEIEKRMDELEEELNSLDNCEDKKYVKKRTKEIIKESRKLTMELMKAISKMSKKGGLLDEKSQRDLDELIDDRKATKKKKKSE